MMDNKENKDKANTEEFSFEQLVDEQDQAGADQAANTGTTDDVEALRRDNEELRDKYLRLLAEFENYKKRTVREKIDLMNTAAQDTMTALLSVLDDFDRAKKSSELPNSDEIFSQGVQLVYHKLYQILRQRGLEPMESNGQPFDPELHEAITEIPSPTEDLRGRVVDTVEKGYKLKDKIIRHAKVVVGK